MPLVHLRENNAANRAQDKLREDNKKAIRAGLPVMTPEVIAETCIENNGYETPELNDKLYLHFKGYQRIENLDAYTGCKGLFLESNGLTKIEGLEALTELRTIYLQQNLLERVENLSHLKQLVVIDLSQNKLTHLSGLDQLPNLDTLNVAQNRIETVEGLQHLEHCSSIINLDVSCNKLDDVNILDVFAKMQKLASLKFAGNPVVSNTRHYRKNALVKLPKLKYLDRPISELERRAAVAYMDGGREAEIAVRDQNARDEKKSRKDSMKNYRKWCKEMEEKKKQKMAEIKAQNPDAVVSNWHSHVDGPGTWYNTMDDAEAARLEAERAETQRIYHEVESEQARNRHEMYYGSDKKRSNQNEEGGDEPPALDGDAGAGGGAGGGGVEWTASLDKKLLQLGRSCLFDFERVASALGPELKGVDADACRVRFAQLKKQGKNQKNGTNAAKAEGGAEGGAGGDQQQQQQQQDADEQSWDWDASLDELLSSLVRQHAFNFDKAAADFADQTKKPLAATDARQRFAFVKKMQKEAKAKPKEPAAKVGPAAPAVFEAWTPALDAKLTELVKKCAFDFGQVAPALEKAAGAGAAIDANVCRVRFAQLKKQKTAAKSMPAAPTAPPAAEWEWTDELDALLGTTVRKLKFDFEAVAKELTQRGQTGAGAGAATLTAAAARVRFSWLRKQQPKQPKQAPKPPAGAEGADDGGAAVEWTPKRDSALLAEVRACSFDFSKVTASLAKGADGFQTSADACRVRFAQLRKQQKEQKAGSSAGSSSSAATTATGAGAASSSTAASSSSDSSKGAYGVEWSLVWTADLDAALSEAVKANAFNFQAAAASVNERLAGSGSTDTVAKELGARECRARYAVIRKRTSEGVLAGLGGRVPGAAGMKMGAGLAGATGTDASGSCRTLPPARHMSWDELQARACENSKLNFKPPQLPSIEDIRAMMETSDSDDDKDDVDDDEEDMPQVKDAGAEAQLPKPLRAKVLSREDIWKEIATAGGLQSSVIADMD